MIIILSSQDDIHVPFAQRHMTDQQVVRIDGKDVINGSALNFVMKNSVFSVTYNGQELTDVSGVWVRRPTLINDLPLPVHDYSLGYVRSALIHHMRQLYTAFPHARWLSDEYAIQRASNKAAQLRIAHELGLHVPDTLFTSDTASATAFIKEHDATIIKMQANKTPRLKDGAMQAMFAVKVSKDTMPDLSGLELAPTIFQQAIEPEYELRITVVGSQIFAAKITLSGVQKNTQQRDWRLGHVEGNLHFTPYELPEDIAGACIMLTKQLGLNYGAIDFIKDTSGTFWFLEINPNGQWAFIEEATQQPIGKAIADFLSGK